MRLDQIASVYPNLIESINYDLNERQQINQILINNSYGASSLMHKASTNCAPTPSPNQVTITRRSVHKDKEAAYGGCINLKKVSLQLRMEEHTELSKWDYTGKEFQNVSLAKKLIHHEQF